MEKNMMFLRSIKCGLHNPFESKNFDIVGSETYGDGCCVHKIGRIKVVYNKKSALIKFFKKDTIAAAYISNMITEDPFGYDRNLKLFVNNYEIKRDNSFNNYIMNIINIIKTSTSIINTIEIEFSSDNVFEYHKQVLIYEIDDEHDDEYWFDVEYDRWKNGYKTSEDI